MGLIDWTLLFIQISLLIFIIFSEILRKKQRNLFAIFVSATLLILVQGQAWWVFRQFETLKVTRLDVVINTFTLDNARTANYYYTICLLCFAFTVLLFRKLRWSKLKKTVSEVPKPRPSVAAYLFVGIWTMMMSGLLITQVGGLNSALTKPGQNVGGQTVFLLAIGIAKWPLILKIINRQKINIFDILLFSIAILITLFNSRFLTAFALLQLFVVINYCRKEISRKVIFLMIVPAIVIFFIFGLYRDFAYRFGTVGASEAASKFTSAVDEFSVLDWFYRDNVEGFTGVAGIINKQVRSGDFHYDFGVSEFVVFMDYIPNSIRNDPNGSFVGLSKYFEKTKPYSGSVVPSGFEQAFGHLGLSGMVIYSLFLGTLIPYFHYYARRYGLLRIVCLLLSVHLLNGVRASIFGSIMFFGVADLVMFGLYNLFLRRSSIKPVNAPKPADITPI
ncbi:MAG TPA: hypothetical protein VNW95_08575 [Mucilaginibacter sp.]|jgi:hypothetical protein|nr:hypothetical protein [Mucilaginibacter sp.]